MRILEESGYLNIPAIRAYQEEKNLVYCWIWGGRGIGKTYGALSECVRRYREAEEKFIFLRRTKTQTDLITNERFMTFKALNTDSGWNYYPFSIGSGMYGFFDTVINPETGKRKAAGPEIGIAMSVSTSGNIRGYDGSDMSTVIYDEFIPLKNERPIKGEADLLFNTLETIGRNRELQGKKPLYFMGLSNSNNVDNPYFLELNLVKRALKMSLADDNQIYEDHRRGLLLICINKSPISEAKKSTSLYSLTAGSDFQRMALDNEFVEVEQKSIKSQDLRAYNPLAAIGGICIYRHKTDNGRYYVSEHIKGNPPVFNPSEIDSERFRRKYFYLYDAYMRDKILFENHLTEYLFQLYNKI